MSGNNHTLTVLVSFQETIGALMEHMKKLELLSVIKNTYPIISYTAKNIDEASLTVAHEVFSLILAQSEHLNSYVGEADSDKFAIEAFKSDFENFLVTYLEDMLQDKASSSGGDHDELKDTFSAACNIAGYAVRAMDVVLRTIMHHISLHFGSDANGSLLKHVRHMRLHELPDSSEYECALEVELKDG